MQIAPGKSIADNDGEVKYIFVNDKSRISSNRPI